MTAATFERDRAAALRGWEPALAIVGLAGLLGHSCMTRAFILAPASVCAPVDFLRLPLVAILGWALYGEAITLPIVLGGAVILLANWININAGRRRAIVQA